MEENATRMSQMEKTWPISLWVTQQWSETEQRQMKQSSEQELKRKGAEMVCPEAHLPLGTWKPKPIPAHPGPRAWDVD